ncbi:MFS transporter [Brucella pseudogrignonensis]|uniref:MFS transporter n=1 Tax=Brucella pseudogrignonensis TaxID=419475 RepID=UPI003D962826
MLNLGLGAMIGMPLAGALSGKLGSRIVTFAAVAGLILSLPLLAVVADPIWLGACLALFGCSIGAIDVAASIHGTEVQTVARAPLMSGFHGFYSIGGLVGASAMTLAISAGLNVLVAGVGAAAIVLLCLVFALPGFLAARPSSEHPLFVMPKGVILLTGGLALIVFLAEGAMLDWGALLLTQVKQVDVSFSGMGYTAFALALTISRFMGDAVVTRFGSRTILVAGFFLTAIGVGIAAFATGLTPVMAGITLAGFAAGNVVPILFTLAGRQRLMPPTHAIAAVSTLGYMGVLVGPALVGYAAHLVGLQIAFGGVALLALVAIFLVPCVTAR